MKTRLLSALLMMGAALSANAQWSGNPATGTPVSTGSPTTAKSNNASATDGANGSFVAWTDSRIAANQSIYIQRVLADGTSKFAGDLLVTNIGNVAGGTSVVKSNLAMVADGAGGVVLLWLDARNTTTTPSNTNNDIYGQRIDANGNLLWAANGVRLTVADNSISNKTSPAMDRINATEVMIVFGDNRTASQVDLYAQKISISTGAALWAGDVSVAGQQTGTPTLQSILADGSGGAFIVNQDQRNGTTNIDVYGQRLDNAGLPLWGAAGVGIATRATSNQTQPTFALDGAGGIVATYGDFLISGGTDPNIYAQRVDGTGTLLWGATGVAVGVAALIQSNPYVVQSGSNYIVAWSDQRLGVGSRDIYAQSLNASGSLQWTPPSMVQTDGIPITVATGNQPNSAANIVLLADAANGAIIIWDDARNTASNLDIYAQRINSAGVVQWTTDGVPVSTATGNQSFPAAINSIGSTVIVNWRDSRTSANGEIFAARLQSTGVLPLRSLALNAFAKSSSIDLKWTTIDERNTASFIVEKSSDGVNFSSIGSVKAIGAGNGNYTLGDLRPVKGINYFRIKAVDTNRSFTYSSTVAVSFGGMVKPSVAVYPNPVLQSATVQLTNLQKGTYRLTLRDVAGRMVLQQSVSIQTDYQQVLLPLQSLSAGAYLLQVSSEKDWRLATSFKNNKKFLCE